MASQAARDRQRRANRRRTTSLLEHLVSGGSEASRQRRPLAAYHRSLTLERLENRCLLATFTDAAPALNLVLAANQNVGVSSSGTAYTLTLNSGTWSGTNDPNISGNGTSTLSVTSAGLSAFTSGVNITDTGSTGGDGVTFNDSGTSGYLNSFVITLSHSSATGLAFNGATTFENSAALTAAVNGAVGINSTAVLTSQAGSIALSSTGTNTALTAGGNVISTSGPVTLQTTGTLTINSGITINSGSAPLTLAADVTAAGAGDDGVGTLSINADATVVTTGTITLRGADVNIDTSSNPAVVGATRSGFATTPIATLSGLDDSSALAFDSSGDLFAANQGNGTVSEIAPGATTPSTTLSGVAYPVALAFDPSGNLFVVNYSNSTVSEFAPGATTPSATLTGLNSPIALAFDPSGNLYVANDGGTTVSEFAPGATTPSATLTGLNGPYALAFDTSGNLFVANNGGTTVSEFAPGATTPSATLTGLSAPLALAFDSSGNLYVANYGGNGTVSEFAPGATTPNTTLTGFSYPVALALDSSDNLYVVSSGSGSVSVFAPGATTASATLTNSYESLAFDSSGNLYANNYNIGTVDEFAPSVVGAAAGVVIQSSVESRPMLVGGTNSSPVAGINLTSAELAQIYTTAAGSVTIGDRAQTGNLTFSTATPVTTAGAGLIVVQATAGAGQVKLDDGAGSGTALNGNGGSISITAGTGGITALSASNSTAEISTTGSAVTLLTAGPIGTSSNRIQFGDNSNTAQQVVSIGSTTLQPSSIYLDGLGSLTVDNVIAYGSSPRVDVTARTNLVVGSGGTINAGSGSILLGADLTAAETGDDGVGTLAINAGATVTTTGTISLRGADVNIDTSSNPAVVGATRALGTMASATYSAGMSVPVTLAFDSSGNLYVANAGGNTVEKFAPGSTTASATYSTGVSDPQALAVDSSGNLYVANFGNSTVEKFAPGSTTPVATYSNGVSGPQALALDSSGNLYVANAQNSTVEMFAPGSTTPSATYSTGLGFTIALAFDSSGNLYVASQDNGTVEKFAPGSTTVSATYSAGLNSPYALAFDSSGNLYVANTGNNTIVKFASGSTTPSATYGSGGSNPYALAFDSSGNLYVANGGNGVDNGTVAEFAPGSTTASATYSAGMHGPHALAFDSSGNLYVANTNGNTVEKFAPGSTTTPLAAGVVIQSSVESRPMLIGGSNSSPVAGINLTSAELAQISTTSSGTVTIGDGQQTGNIKFSTATPATTPGAGLVVVQEAAGAGQVILDDGADSGTALNGNGGSISITAGTGGISALSASDSTAEISTTASAVTLLTTGPIGTSSNRIQFADNANTAQQVVSIGSTTLQPSSIYLDGLGSLTLDNVIAYGPSPTVDVTARTNLVVGSGGTINAGSGPIRLGADLTAAETGDDGVGTLSINSGATVTTTGTITLRGADVNIDTSSIPAVVGATHDALATTPSATLTGLNNPDALAFDSSGDLYVANFVASGTVSEFAPGATTPSATLTGLGAPDALAFDSSGNLYVANWSANTVSVFAPGSTTPTETLTGLSGPDALAFDSSGNLYVASGVVGSMATISVFARGSTTPTSTLTGVNRPDALAFDSSGNLYVANNPSNAGLVPISVFSPGSTTPTSTLTGVNGVTALAFDSSGNLYASSFRTNAVSIFAPGGTAPSATLTGLDYPYALALDSSGNLYVANGYGATVSEFAPGATTPSSTLTGLDEPQALAFDSSGNLYVANAGSGTVSEFAPASVTPATAGVVIQSSVESRPMLVGGSNSSPVAGINLTSAELAQIYTTAAGSVTIGDTAQTGNITLSTATPATTAGASVNVVQDTAGAGQIILDDGAGTATALNGNGGNITLTAGTGGISALAATNSTAEIGTTGASVTLVTSGPIGTSTNRIQFADDANTAQQIVSIGSLTVQPSSVYLDALGSLTLGSILGGGTPTTIDVTAQTKLVFSAAVTGDLVLVVATGGATEIDAALSVESLDVKTGSTEFDGGSVSTATTQDYAGAVTISSETTLKSTGTGAAGAISFGSTIDGIGGGLDTLHVVTSGLTTIVGAVGGSASSPDMEALDVQVGPAEIEGGVIATRSVQYYGNPVTITQDTTLTSTRGEWINFNSLIDGSAGTETLVVNTTGLTTFSGPVGGSAGAPDLESLNVTSGPTQVNGGSISTLGTQNYAGAISISSETTLKSTGTGAAGAISFGSTIDGIGSGLDTLHVVTAGLTTIVGAVGGSASSPDIEALDVQVGPAEIEGGVIATRSVQYYGNPVTIAQNTALTSSRGEWIDFNSTVDAGRNPAGLTITTSYPYTNDSGSPQLFDTAVGGQSPLSYLAANVEGGIVLNSPISTTGDMLLGGTTLMPAVLQVNADLKSTFGSIGLTSSIRVFTSIGDTISAPTGTITFSAGTGYSDQSLVALYSTMQATGVFVTGNAASNQLHMQPLGEDLLVNESDINSGTIGSYQGVNGAGQTVPFVQYTNEQNIALEYSPGTESTSTLSIFTASNSSPTAVTTTILPIASFEPFSTSAVANEANFYLEDNDIANVDVRVGRGNQTVDASQTNANTLLEGDAYQEAGVSDTLTGGHAYNVLIGGQSQATLVAGDGADIAPGSGDVSPTVANYIFTHYEYTVAGGVGQWADMPTSISSNPVVDTVNGSAATQNSNTTNEIVSNGADVINAAGSMLTSGQATINSSPGSNTTETFTQANVDAAETATIEAIFPQTASGSSVFSSSSSPAGTQVVAAIPINYSPTPTTQSTDYAAPPVFYVPAQYASGATPLLISDSSTGDTIDVDLSSDGSQVTVTAAGFDQTWNSSLFSSIQVDANGNAVESSATAGNSTTGSIDAQSKQAYASIQYLVAPPAIPSINVSGAQTLTIDNESGAAVSLGTLYQLSSSVSTVGQTGLTDGTSSLSLTNYGSGNVTIDSNNIRP
jgi:sugar lactone lactonase YvrE